MQTQPTQRVTAEIRSQLARRRVSQATAAARLGISQAAMSRRLVGRVAFDVEELAALADLFEIDLSDLIPRPDSAA